MKKNTIETITGILVVFAAIYFVIFSLNTKNSENKDGNTYELNINFDRVDGINIGGDVRLSGYKVGTIDKIGLNPKTYQAEVTIAINDEFKIPEDSSAEIISAGLLGDKYIALVPGSSDVYLEEGDKIIFSQPSISIESLVGKFLFGSSDKQEPDNKAPSGDDSFLAIDN